MWGNSDERLLRVTKARSPSYWLLTRKGKKKRQRLPDLEAGLLLLVKLKRPWETHSLE